MDLDVEGGPLRIAGQTFASGLGGHAIGEIPLAVQRDAVGLSGSVGVDDSVGVGNGSVKFRILSGNRILWESEPMKSGDPAVDFSVSVPANRHRRLYLQADDLGANGCDHANWVNLQWRSGESPPLVPARVFAGKEFGLRPGVTNDQSAALNQALQALRDAPGSTLRLEKGVYHFHSSGALRKHFHISNHENPPWHPVSLPLVDLRDVTLDGQDSLFLFHGEVLPVLIQDSARVTLRNLALDYAIPHHSQGTLTRVTPEAYEIKVDPVLYPHDIRDGWFVFKGEGWSVADAGTGIVFDGRTRALVAGTGDFDYRGALTDLGGGRYRVKKNLAAAGIKAGDAIVLRQSLWVNRPHPAVALYRAEDIVLENCRLHSSHGMALLAQRSKNIRFSGGGVYPRPETGRYFSSIADATHFSNCRGMVIVENARFEGMLDDAINVHATCLRIEEKLDARTLRCRYVHNQSVGFETFLPGETLQFIEARRLTPRDPRRVTAVRRTKTNEVLLTLDSPAPEDLGPGDAVENAEWFPEVVFRGNTVCHNRARGSLFTTPRRVVVENNRFEAVAGSALLLAGDANGWYESGGCTDVLIRNNLFRNNLTSRFQFTEAILSIYPEIPDLAGQTAYYHQNVRIEDNRFETFDVPLLYAISTRGLTFRGNHVVYNRAFPGWNQPPFHLRRCDHVTIERNTVVRDGRAVTWSARDIQTELTPPEAVTVR